jgi:ATP-dependent DNA ligase
MHFDLLWFDGRDLRGLPLLERKMRQLIEDSIQASIVAR